MRLQNDLGFNMLKFGDWILYKEKICVVLTVSENSAEIHDPHSNKKFTVNIENIKKLEPVSKERVTFKKVNKPSDHPRKRKKRSDKKKVKPFVISISDKEKLSEQLSAQKEHEKTKRYESGHEKISHWGTPMAKFKYDTYGRRGMEYDQWSK